jgi:hypothetical protein
MVVMLNSRKNVNKITLSPGIISFVLGFLTHCANNDESILLEMYII